MSTLPNSWADPEGSTHDGHMGHMKIWEFYWALIGDLGAKGVQVERCGGHMWQPCWGLGPAKQSPGRGEKKPHATPGTRPCALLLLDWTQQLLPDMNE